MDRGINHGLKFAFVGYAAQLMAKTIYFVIHPDERPLLPEEPPHLASQYKHPDKDLIPRFSRYKKITIYNNLIVDTQITCYII